MKPSPTIKEIIHEMVLYWSIPSEHELKTIRQFKKFTDPTKPLQSITPEMLMRYWQKLRAESKGTDESCKRQYDYVKRTFKYAHSKGYIKTNITLLTKLPKSRKAKIISLLPHEVDKLRNVQLPKHLQFYRDCFLFQCLTGLSFQGLNSFNRSKVIEVNGKIYIHDQRGKTDVEYVVPITLEAFELAEKNEWKFTNRCVQVYNRRLKDIQRIAGIETVLTTHVGRRTFGQTMLDVSVPLETVARMLGHATTATTQKYYARVGIKRVVNDVAHLATAA